MSRSRDFPDGAALVFGGSGGIGSAICRGLAQAGSPIALTYLSNSERAHTVVDLIRRDDGAQAEAYGVDVTDADAVAGVVQQATQRFGRIHTAVFVAGAVPSQSYIAQYELAEWNEAIDIETRGFFHVVRAMLPHFRAAGGGSFVHLGTAADLAWAARDGLSIVPKAANEALVRGVAREEGRFGIRANSVLIGVIEAGMFLTLSAAGVFDQAWVDNTLRRLALKRLGKPEEVAEAVVFLASNRASYITGQQIAVAGGYGV